MKINIYYGGRGLIDDPTLYVIEKMESVFRELRVVVERFMLYDMKNSITMLSGLAMSLPMGARKRMVAPHTSTALPSPTISAAETTECDSRVFLSSSYLAVSLETMRGIPLVVAVSSRKNMLKAT